MMLQSARLKRFIRILKAFLAGCGIFFIAVLLFSFTTGPFWIYHWLGTSEGQGNMKADYIIIMGGTGYPSEAALLRCWYAAYAYEKNPEATIIISQPAAVCRRPELSDAWGMRNDIILRGVDSTRILLEIKGRNTREECLKILEMAPDAAKKNCLLITAPEHMRRSVLSFRKAGFTQVGGLPTFNYADDIDLDYSDESLGGRSKGLPEVGGSLQLRYQFWNHLRYQVICYRELFALAWYKIKGWA